ncbi:HNH endonuclease signature motif containing protein [Streptomyces mirabilis]|uniref:HNH endonuclease n=1 Tax=Streptomyces mirabilis TaxID=68239 RepID=A0A1I2VRR5_9ACTN|nr:HNH endonuclease signature motif containing protein [Streptomyces mirabilis]SFG89871.1 HNH endonuclease [Streptomyces mirabilis]
MALTDITRIEVEKAIEECDRLGRDAFLNSYGFRHARRYLLVQEGKHYDSKAIVGAAHGFLPDERPLAAKDFSGGAEHAARLLRDLGFDIVEELQMSTLTHDELIHRVINLKVNRSSGRRALYKPIALLWAMGRALRGEPRLLPWSETEEALKALLQRHGMRGERLRPDYPVASLYHDGLWTLHAYADAVTTAHGDAEVLRWFGTNQPLGGLAEPVYDLFRHSAVTSLAVIDELLGTFFEDLDPAPLLADVGLDDTETADPPDRTEREPEQWLITAAEYERGCKLVEQREAKTHGARISQTTRSPRRSRAARYLVLNRSQGRCENPNCTGQPSDVTDRKQPILEVDHVVDLALGGHDHPRQMVALCPNCHAVKTRGSTREALREMLLIVAMERHVAYMSSDKAQL